VSFIIDFKPLVDLSTRYCSKFFSSETA